MTSSQTIPTGKPKGAGRTRGAGRWHCLSGLTIIELLAAVCVFSIILGLGFQGTGKSKREAERRAEEAEAKVLNDAIRRVEIGGRPGEWMSLSNILFVKEDKDEAVQWLEDNGYVMMRKGQIQGLD